MKEKNIYSSVIKKDLCTGCGACAYLYSKEELEMKWDNKGFLIPTSNDWSLINENSLKVCPFNPYPEEGIVTEDEISDLFLKETPNKHPRVGRYFNTYAGYSNEYRLTSSSGGMATYVLSKLFDKKIIDAAIAVGEGEKEHYEYNLVKSKNELLSTSKTKYYPVSLANALQMLKEFDGKVAIVGVGCFIKAIRLLQYYYPELKENIVFTVGIICGGLKSKFFTEFLAGKAGIDNSNFTKPQFRIKDYQSSAGDYSFGCFDSQGKKKQIKMRTVGDMWGSGMFKSNACDYCDDVTTELADISLGDAWLEPYLKDGKGTNVIVTRSQLAEEIVIDGILNKALTVEPLDFKLFLSSQQGSFNHRQKALGYRLMVAKKKGRIIPPKRHDNEKIPIDFKWVQRQRMVVRERSFIHWDEAKNSNDFDNMMSGLRNELKKRTKINHAIRKIKRIIKI